MAKSLRLPSTAFRVKGDKFKTKKRKSKEKIYKNGEDY
jgi:hypothetical protein